MLDALAAGSDTQAVLAEWAWLCSSYAIEALEQAVSNSDHF